MNFTKFYTLNRMNYFTRDDAMDDGQGVSQPSRSCLENCARFSILEIRNQAVIKPFKFWVIVDFA